MQANLDDGCRCAEGGCGLHRVALLDVSQRQDRSVVIGKLRNRPPHHCRRLFALEDRITPVTRLRRLVSVGLKRGEQIVDGLLGSPLSRTDLHERRVHEDAMQPGVKLRALFERADRSERFDEGFLHGVLRVFVVRQEAASHGE